MTVLSKSDAVSASSSSSSELTEAEAKQVVADVNHMAISRIVESLAVAQEESGRAISQVAELLGIQLELLQDILSGAYELSMGELEEVLYAVDAVLDVRIVLRATQEIKKGWRHLRLTEGEGQWIHAPEAGKPAWTWRVVRTESLPGEGSPA